MQVYPTIALQSFIKHYLFLQSNEIGVHHLRLFSDANTGIVFSLNSTLQVKQIDEPNGSSLPTSFLYGQLVNYRDIRFANQTNLLIVVFKPDGVFKLLGIAGYALKDRFIDLIDIMGSEVNHLQEMLLDATTLAAQTDALNQFFENKIPNRQLESSVWINACLNFITLQKGNVNSAHLVQFTGYTERHIERKFIESTGITPKHFARITKLHCALREMSDATYDHSLTSLGYETGYYDQSHFIKEFKSCTGLSPKEYKIRVKKIARNFVEFV